MNNIIDYFFMLLMLTLSTVFAYGFYIASIGYNSNHQILCLIGMASTYIAAWMIIKTIPQ